MTFDEYDALALTPIVIPAKAGIQSAIQQEVIMPTISMFYGIIISMYFLDHEQHKLPHIHVQYQDEEAVFSIRDSAILRGSIPIGKVHLVQAWIEIHRESLLANWKLATNGQSVQKIPPLR